MGPDEQFFIILIVLIATGGWILNNWIRARHGYALEDEWGGKTERRDDGEARALAESNAKLTARVETMEDRLVVLEKIVTDRGYDLADRIEALRETRGADHAGSGVPLDLERKERV